MPRPSYLVLRRSTSYLVPTSSRRSAITPEGRATNLGELQVSGDDGELNVTTELQAFGLVVTAEPYFAVSQPSDVVVLENVIREEGVFKPSRSVKRSSGRPTHSPERAPKRCVAGRPSSATVCASSSTRILETWETARGLIVNLSDVLFDFNKADLKPGAREKMAKIAGILLTYPSLQIALEGHADNIGSDEYNQRLSERAPSPCAAT